MSCPRPPQMIVGLDSCTVSALAIAINAQSEIIANGVSTLSLCDENGDKVVFEICKQTDGNIKYTPSNGNEPIVGSIVDVFEAGYGVCDEVNIKATIDSYFNTITDDSKYTFTPATPLDSIKVAINDPDRCNFVRVTFICPDGQVGCILITPTEPIRSIGLPRNTEITEICFEVVEKTPGTSLKDWPVVTPTTDIDINVDGLDT